VEINSRQRPSCTVAIRVSFCVPCRHISTNSFDKCSRQRKNEAHGQAISISGPTQVGEPRQAAVWREASWKARGLPSMARARKNSLPPARWHEHRRKDARGQGTRSGRADRGAATVDGGDAGQEEGRTDSPISRRKEVRNCFARRKDGCGSCAELAGVVDTGIVGRASVTFRGRQRPLGSSSPPCALGASAGRAISWSDFVG